MPSAAISFASACRTGLPVNEWMRVLVTGLDKDGLQASRITTAHETN